MMFQRACFNTQLRELHKLHARQVSLQTEYRERAEVEKLEGELAVIPGEPASAVDVTSTAAEPSTATEPSHDVKQPVDGDTESDPWLSSTIKRRRIPTVHYDEQVVDTTVEPKAVVIAGHASMTFKLPPKLQLKPKAEAQRTPRDGGPLTRSQLVPLPPAPVPQQAIPVPMALPLPVLLPMAVAPMALLPAPALDRSPRPRGPPADLGLLGLPQRSPQTVLPLGTPTPTRRLAAAFPEAGSGNGSASASPGPLRPLAARAEAKASKPRLPLSSPLPSAGTLSSFVRVLGAGASGGSAKRAREDRPGGASEAVVPCVVPSAVE